MIKLTQKFSSNIKNGVFLVLSLNDISQLDILSLDQRNRKILEKAFQKQKNTCIHLYIEHEIFEEIWVLVYCDKSQDIRVFLGEHVSSLPKKLTFSYEEDNILLDGIVL